MSHQKDLEKTAFYFTYAAFSVYVLLMLYLLFIRNRTGTYSDYLEQLRHSYNLVPLHTISLLVRVLKGSSSTEMIRFSIYNLFGNVLLFIPFGFFLPRLFKICRSLPVMITITAGVIISIELLQLFTLLGSCDIDDLLLNLIGTLIGFAVFRFISEIEKKSHCSSDAEKEV